MILADEQSSAGFSNWKLSNKATEQVEEKTDVRAHVLYLKQRKEVIYSV